MDKIYEKYTWFSEAVSIPLSICGESGQLQYSSAVRRDAFPEFLLRICVEDFRLQKRSARTPLMILLPPDWFLGIARLNTGSYLILGPAPLRSFSAEELVPACRNLLEGKSLLAFCDLLLHTPICSLRRFTISFASALTLSGVDSVSPDEISLSNDNLPVGNMEQNLHHELIQGRENSVLHVTEHYENELFSSVEAGDVALLKRIVMQPLGGTPGKLSRDLLRQARYTFVVVATNATRAAIRGGLPGELAFSLSDLYCQQMDTMKNVYDIQMLSMRMLLDFTQKVAEAKKNVGYSRPIRRCITYIHAHLHDPITVQQLSACCGLKDRAISQRFRQELELSVPRYIQQERMKEAKFLLEHTDSSIAEIGNLLQFCSQSYFTQIFRKTYGCTPQQFREMKVY